MAEKALMATRMTPISIASPLESMAPTVSTFKKPDEISLSELHQKRSDETTILTLRGEGQQTKLCQQTPTGPQWVKGARADLTINGTKVGEHFAGYLSPTQKPIWILNQNSVLQSVIHGTVQFQAKDTAHPQNAMSLGLSAQVNSSNSALKQASSIWRINITGGGSFKDKDGNNADQKQCTTENLGEEIVSDYKTDYPVTAKPT